MNINLSAYSDSRKSDGGNGLHFSLSLQQAKTETCGHQTIPIKTQPKFKMEGKRPKSETVP